MPAPIPKNAPQVRDLTKIQRNAITEDESLYSIESILNTRILYVVEPDYITIISYGKAIRIPYAYIDEINEIIDDTKTLKRMEVSLENSK